MLSHFLFVFNAGRRKFAQYCVVTRSKYVHTSSLARLVLDKFA